MNYKPIEYPYKEHHRETVSREFIENLQRAINGEATAIKFYGELLQRNRQDRTAYDNIKHAYDDENKHLRSFVDLYVQLTGQQPNIQPSPVRYSSLADAYRIAFFDELEAAGLYKEMYLATPYTSIRDIFFNAHSDELEHAQRFHFLYNRALRRKELY